MSCRETGLFQLRSLEPAMSLYVGSEGIARRSICMFCSFFSLTREISSLTIFQADRLAYLEEKVNLILNGGR